MAVDIFLKMDIDGESTDDAHSGEIDVAGWRWGAQNTGSATFGSGSGSGKVEVENLIVEKVVDKSSAELMLACCNGKHFEEIILTCRKAGESPLEYVKITLNDVVVGSISTVGSAMANDELTEEVSFNFQKVKYEYTPQKQDGSGDSTVTCGWDVGANCEL